MLKSKGIADTLSLVELIEIQLFTCILECVVDDCERSPRLSPTPMASMILARRLRSRYPEVPTQLPRHGHESCRPLRSIPSMLLSLLRPI